MSKNVKIKRIVTTVIIIVIAISIMGLYFTKGIEKELKDQIKTYDVSNVYEQYQKTKEIKEYDQLINTLIDLNVQCTVYNSKVNTEHISYNIENSTVYIQDSNIVKEIEMFSGRRVVEEGYKLTIKEDKSILEKIDNENLESLLSFEDGRYIYEYLGDIDKSIIFFHCMALSIMIVLFTVVCITCVWVKKPI